MLYRLTSAAVVSVMLFAAGVMAQTTTGTLSGTETWSGTVTVTGDVIVEGSLTIDPGTVVKFATSNDNIVMGSGSQIRLVVMPGGTFQAIGTEASPIKFTTTSLFASPGSWGKIQIIANGSKSAMDWCNLEYQANAVVVEKPSGVTGTSNFSISNCHFKSGSSTALFTSNGDSVTVTNCFVDQCKKGFFHNGAGYLGIFNTIIYKASCGLISAGSANWTSVVEVDHVTMYDIDMMLAGTSPQWWDGYGIFPTNTGYTLTLTNSILYQSTLANLIANSWTVVENNNCFHTGLMGIANYEGGTVNTAGGSIEGDPMFADAPNAWGLDALSPCIGTASDGTNMGADQTVIPGVSVNDRLISDGSVYEARTMVVEGAAVFSGLKAGARIDVYSMGGARIATETASGAQHTLKGGSIAAGAYVYTVTVDGVTHQGNLVVVN